MRKKVFVIDSHARNLKPLREKIMRFLRKSGVAQKVRHDILCAVGEACTNSIRHSYLGEPGRKIRVTAVDGEKNLLFKVRDYGRKIDLRKVKPPRLPRVRPGGLGIYFMKTMMDKLAYNTRHSRGNELIMVKYKKGS